VLNLVKLLVLQQKKIIRGSQGVKISDINVGIGKEPLPSLLALPTKARMLCSDSL
jgi:hypothetical protein